MKKIISLLLTLTLTLNVFATKYYVNDGNRTGDIYTSSIGSNSNSGLSPSLPMLSLTNILSTYSGKFNAGDTIFVDAGTYGDHDLTSPLVGINIVGAGMNKTLFVNNTTTNPSNSADSYFMLVNANNTTLSNFKLSGYNGTGDLSTEVLQISGKNVQINNVQVNGSTNGTDSPVYYPIEVTGGSVTFNGGGVTCNNQQEGGGIHVNGSSTIVNIINYQFLGGGNSLGGYNGLAINVQNGTVNVTNSRFQNNVIDYYDYTGAAIYQSGGTLNINNSYFNSNSIQGTSSGEIIGGAISIWGGSFNGHNILFKNNQANTLGGGYGGAIGVVTGTVKLDSCTFIGNTGTNGNNNTYGKLTNTNVGLSNLDTNNLPKFTGNCSSGITLIPLCTNPTISITQNSTIDCKNKYVVLNASSNGTLIWNNSYSNPDTVYSAGTYTVTSTNLGGCSVSSTVTITSNAVLPSLSVNTPKIINCKNLSDTLIGTSDGTILWNGIFTNPFVINNSGTYTVVATGSNGCMTSTSIIVNKDTSIPVINVSNSDSLILNCKSTSLSLNATSINSKLTWSNNNTNPFTINNPGTYVVMALDTLNGCSVTKSVTVSKDTSLPSISYKSTIDTLNGKVTLTCKNPVDTITWNFNNHLVINSVGTYTLTTTGLNGCSASTLVNVVMNDTLPVINYTLTSPYLNCNIISDTIRWNNNQSMVIDKGGYYILTTTGSNGCSSATTVNIKADSILPSLSIVNLTPKVLNCKNLSDTLSAIGSNLLWNGIFSNPLIVNNSGTYTVTSTGNNGCISSLSIIVSKDTTPPTITYNLSNPILNCKNPVDTIKWNSQYLVVTTPGTYTLTTTGLNGCSSTTSVIIGASLSLPQLSITKSVDTLTCSNRYDTLMAKSTSPNTSIIWNGGISNPLITSKIGTYNVVITDTLTGCYIKDSVVIGQNITTPNLTYTSSVDTLNGGVVVLDCKSISDTIKWNLNNLKDTIAVLSTIGTYTLTTTGSNGCTSNSVVKILKNDTLPTITYTSTIDTLNGVVILSCKNPIDTIKWNLNNTLIVNSPGVYSLTTSGKNGCLSSTNVEVVMNDSLPKINVKQSDTLNCKFKSIDLNASTDGFTIYWNGGYPNPFTVNTAGTYTVTSVGLNGCKSSKSVLVVSDTISPKASFTYNPNVIFSGNEVNFINSSINSSIYNWIFISKDSVIGNSNSENPQQILTDSIYYIKLVASNNICSDSTIQQILVHPKCGLLKSIPNIFTPNNDNKNDVFKVTSIGSSNLNCGIFNRWGDEITTLNGINSSWDGSNGILVPDGTYYYTCNLNCLDGTKQIFKGFFVLIR